MDPAVDSRKRYAEWANDKLHLLGGSRPSFETWDAGWQAGQEELTRWILVEESHPLVDEWGFSDKLAPLEGHRCSEGIPLLVDGKIKTWGNYNEMTMDGGKTVSEVEWLTWDQLGPEDGEITHWMPLPASPKK